MLVSTEAISRMKHEGSELYSVRVSLEEDLTSEDKIRTGLRYITEVVDEGPVTTAYL
jgi:hypothetical protein